MTTHLETSASWDQQHLHQPVESLEESAERVSHLFATTITSLTADVHALRHLTTWKDIINDNEENGDGHDEHREEFLESLCDLDDVVTAVEKKVGVLRQIVSEEQQALESLQLLHKDSLEQNENLQFLIERCQNMKVTEQKEQQQQQAKSNKASSTKGALSTKAQPSRKSTTNTAKPAARAPLTSNGASQHQEHHAHIEGLSCHFDPVSVEELERVPRTTRGRVQVQVINEALDNMSKCFHKKAVKQRKQQQLLEDSRHVALAHYQGVQDEDHMDDEEFLQNLVVTEQELRQSCAFFLAGEGTARTVIAVLKALKRIKQVPQKKKGGAFMYSLYL